MRILALSHSPNISRDVGPLLDRLNNYASPGTTIEVGFPDAFPGSGLEMVSGENNLIVKSLAIPALMNKAVWAQENGFDAVIQRNTYDPGVEAGRLAVRIPVIGAMRTSLHIGLNLADRIGITIAGNTALPALERHVWRIVRSYGLNHFITGIRPMEGAYSALLEGNKSAIFDIAVDTINRLVNETNAEIVLPLGGAIIPHFVDTVDLEEATGVQVLNTSAIAIAFAEMCVNLGLTQSAITYPPPPSQVAAKDFEFRD